MNDWIDFYDSAPSIYVSDKHREVHFRVIADQIIGYIPSADALVLDYSCGEALSAARVAQACGRLILAEPAPNLRERLTARFQRNPKIEVCSLDALADIRPHSLDLVVMNSVAQYITADELTMALQRIHLLLKCGGRLVLGDILRPRITAVSDATALLRFGHRHGFLKDAVTGLVRTAMSDYRKLRSRIGLNRYSESEILAKLDAAGFSAMRARHNLGHNRKRMTFVATTRSIPFDKFSG